MSKAEPRTSELIQLEMELARMQERFAVLESAAHGCCDGALRAAQLGEKIKPVDFSDPTVRKRAEGLSKTAIQLSGFEKALRAHIVELRQPLQVLEAFGIQRG